MELGFRIYFKIACFKIFHFEIPFKFYYFLIKLPNLTKPKLGHLNMHSSDLANLAFRMFAKNLHANDDQHMPAMEKGKI